MEYLIIIYLLFQIGIGVLYFSFNYFAVEKRIKERKEFLLLIFLPLYGFGNWKYNREIRLNGKTELPKNWYIWKYMIPVNTWFIATLAIVLLVFTIITMTSEVFDSNVSSDNIYSAVLEGFGNMFIGLIIVLILLGLFIVLFVIGLVLILVPKLNVKSIESEYYKNKFESNKTV